jgi:hypothetical protein
MCLPAVAVDDDPVANGLAADGGDPVAKLFAGPSERWRAIYDALAVRLGRLGPDVAFVPTETMIVVRRGSRTFALVQPAGATRLDVGIRLHGLAATARFEAAGTWNGAVTHRVGLRDAGEVDEQLHAWLRWAYAAAAGEP